MEAAQLIKDVDSFSADSKHRSTRISEELAVEKLKELRFLAVRIFFNSGDYERAYSHCRVVLFQCPYDFALMHVFNRIIAK
jgi:hypothetical protein